MNKTSFIILILIIVSVVFLVIIFFKPSNQNIPEVSSSDNLDINPNQYSNDLFQSEEGSSRKEAELPSIVNGKQVLKIDASSRGYSPNYLKVKVGIPVRWEITDKGTSGCTNAIISEKLFEGEIFLIPDQVSIKEFTPEKIGKYEFSCWMGMISGTIEVIDNNDSVQNSTTNDKNTTQNNATNNIIDTNTNNKSTDYKPSPSSSGYSCH